MKRILSILLLVKLCIIPMPLKAEAENDQSVFFCCRFDGKSTLFRSSESDIEFTSDNTMHFISGGSSVFADTECSAAANVDCVVVDAKIKIDKAEGNGAIVLFESKEDRSVKNPNWRTGVKISSGAIMTLGNGTYKCKMNEWFRYSAIYNIKSGTCSVYVDGTLLDTFSKINGTVHHSLFRISREVKGTSAGNFDFSVDDVAIYPGIAPLSEDDYNNLSETESIFNEDDESLFYLKDCQAYSVTGRYYFKNGMRIKYPENVDKPILKNGKVYITKAFLNEFIGKNVIGKVSEEYNGKAYYELSDENVYIYERGGGFFVLSDSTVALNDSDHFLKIFDSADVVYRYLQFDNPKSSDISADFNENITSHPRIFINSEDIDYIRQKSQSDNLLWKKAYDKCINNANDVISRYPVTASCIDSKKQSEASNLYKTVKNCVLAYKLTGNTSYADKSIEKVLTVCSWQTAGNAVSNLTAGYLAMSFAMCYDGFYDILTQDQKDFIKLGANKLVLSDMVLAYKGAGGPDKMKWMKMNDNFVGFISGSAAAFCVAFGDEEDMKDDILYLLPNVIKSMEISLSVYGTNGGFYEGTSYSEFMLEMIVYGVEGLIRCCGTDYGLGTVKGFTEAGSMFVYLTGSENQMNFHDTDSYFDSAGKYISPRVMYTDLPFWFAARYGETLCSELNMRKYIQHPSTLYGGENTPGLLGLFWYSTGVLENGSADVSDAPLDRYFDTAEAGSFRSGFDSKNETFAGFHGGYTGLTHDMLDIGEFVFESGGIPWAIDIGKDNYNLPKYFEREDLSGQNITGYRYYRKRPEGKNCIVINPAVNPDGYDGQAVNQSSRLLFFRGDKSSAMAAYDMSNVYSRDVKDYKRGYYFGDNRQTLLIQDEIDLLDTSEIYWFMHSGANIEITDNNTALLSKNGKTLRAEVYCNGGECVLSVNDAEPLATSPEPPGIQSKNTGIKKLTLHVQNARGKVTIAVKLIPTDANDAKALKVREILKWDLPSDEYDLIIKNASVSYDNILYIKADLPRLTSRIEAFCDGKMISEFEPEETGETSFKLDISDIPAGEHEILLKATVENIIKKAKTRFVVKGSVFYENDLSNGGENTVNIGNGWTFSSDDKNLILAVKRASDYRKLYVSFGIFESEFDVILNEEETSLSVTALNSAAKEYPSNGNIALNGIFSNGESVITGQVYHIRITTDFGLGEQKIYLSDNTGERLIGDYTKKTLIHSLVKLEISADKNVSYKNAVYKFYPNDFKFLSLTENGKGVCAEIDGSDCIIMFAEFSSGGKLCSVQKGASGDLFEISDNTEYVKVMAFEALDNLNPVCASAYFSAGN